MQNNQMPFRHTPNKRSILLIEDEIVNQKILEMYLNDTFDILIAGTGADALAIIHSQSEILSLILLDLKLPDCSGIDILKEVKMDIKYAHIPVIVMTSDNKAEVECLRLGAHDFIPKPYPQQMVILARVQRTIELTEDRDIIRWTERDQLTGLYNKEFFFRYAVQLDIHNRECPTDAIFLNINHFHMINDRYGKIYGDEVLRLISTRIRDLLKSIGGVGARNGADNFLIYCPHRSDYDAILQTISNALNDDGKNENRVRLRMGVYSNVDKKLDIERRFDRAKLAADRVKGNFVKAIGHYDSSMYEKELFSEQLIEDFATAIRERQFQVFYQPKFDVRHIDPVLCSAEALVRWFHPSLGMVNPGIFIKLFEENGLISTLDFYVWSEVATQIKKWKEKFGIILPVSVNVSRIDLYDPQIVEKLQNLVAQNELSHEALLLEITESAYTEDSEQIIQKVTKLRESGFQIEMDDFGSGYSSLNMLTTLPIDALKIDMNFIRNAFKEQKDTRLLKAIILLAESLELQTIAEGVETLEQMSTLKKMGCSIVQGYYFSRPLPSDEFESLINKHISNGNLSNEVPKN